MKMLNETKQKTNRRKITPSMIGKSIKLTGSDNPQNGANGLGILDISRNDEIGTHQLMIRMNTNGCTESVYHNDDYKSIITFPKIEFEMNIGSVVFDSDQMKHLKQFQNQWVKSKFDHDMIWSDTRIKKSLDDSFIDFLTFPRKINHSSYSYDVFAEIGIRISIDELKEMFGVDRLKKTKSFASNILSITINDDPYKRITETIDFVGGNMDDDDFYSIFKMRIPLYDWRLTRRQDIPAGSVAMDFGMNETYSIDEIRQMTGLELMEDGIKSHV